MSLTSAFDDVNITVADMVDDPTIIQGAVQQALDGAFLDDLIFRRSGPNDNGVVRYRENESPYLEGEPEIVAEFGEIPLLTDGKGQWRVAVAEKRAAGIAVSYEMLKRNDVGEVEKRIKKLARTMIRYRISEARAAIMAAEGVGTGAAGAAWTTPGADIIGDITKAKTAIGLASLPDDKNTLFGYTADTMVLPQATLDAMMGNEKINARFTGDMAHAHPIFRGVQDFSLFGMAVAVSNFMPANEVWVLDSEISGFTSDWMPLEVSELYAERGNSNRGGATMAWRSDASYARAMAVDNPKAVYKITSVNA